MNQTASATTTPATVDSNTDQITVPKYVEKFLNKIQVSPEGHWLYTGGLSANGYGVCTVEGRPVLAHRASYSFFVDDLPSDDLVIGHAGGCPRHCVNPEHLSAITRQQNQQQRITDGTMYVPRRKRVPATNEEIADIRRRAAKGETKYSIAKLYDRSETYIGRVVNCRIHNPDKPAKKPKKIIRRRSPAPTSAPDVAVMQEAA